MESNTMPNLTVLDTPKTDGGKSYWEKAAWVGVGVGVGVGGLLLFDALTPVRVLPTSAKLCPSKAERELADEIRAVIRADVSSRKFEKEMAKSSLNIKSAQKIALKAVEAHNKTVDRVAVREARLHNAGAKLEAHMEAAEVGKPEPAQGIEVETPAAKAPSKSAPTRSAKTSNTAGDSNKGGNAAGGHGTAKAS